MPRVVTSPVRAAPRRRSPSSARSRSLLASRIPSCRAARPRVSVPPPTSPTAPVGRRPSVPSAYTNRPGRMTAAGSAPSCFSTPVRLSATSPPAVGPTPSVSSLCWWPFDVLVGVRVVRALGRRREDARDRRERPRRAQVADHVVGQPDLEAVARRLRARSGTGGVRAARAGCVLDPPRGADHQRRGTPRPGCSISCRSGPTESTLTPSAGPSRCDPPAAPPRRSGARRTGRPPRPP